MTVTRVSRWQCITGGARLTTVIIRTIGIVGTITCIISGMLTTGDMSTGGIIRTRSAGTTCTTGGIITCTTGGADAKEAN